MKKSELLEIIAKAAREKATSLDLSRKGIKTIPPEIANLTSLTTLVLFGNQITEIPESLTNLTNLTKLSLHSNQITEIPESLTNLTSLTLLDLRNNPLPIPVEILNDYKNPPAIFDFWAEQERKPLNEAKVIFVGQGTVGKTSLVKRLLKNQFDAAEGKTEGIEIHDWQIEAKQENIKLRVWDFGGQEIMHATHQFFLTERSLYLLVINTREDERANKIEYWLKLIETLGQQAPVIIVGNKVDDHPLDLDERGLQNKYPNIKAFIGTSCLKGLGIAELKKQITEIIAEQMPHVFDPIPVRWLTLKDQLEQDDRDYISYGEYEQKCIVAGITRTSSRHTLVRLLHELGIILNFSDDRRLKDTNVLNPEWVTAGAYKVINDNLLMTKHKGVLYWHDSARVFQPKSRQEQNCYATEKDRKFILEMMEKFELCFPMDNSSDRDYPDYLIPDLLPKEEQDTGTWEDCLNFEYHYDKVLPNSVISRFIVKARRHIDRSPKPTYWRTGVILISKEGNKAQVRADLEDNKIFVRISGNSSTRRSFLSIIRDIFDAIHEKPALPVSENVALPDNSQITVPYDHLCDLERDGTLEFTPYGTRQRYQVRSLLDGIETISERSDRIAERYGDTYNIYGSTGQIITGTLKAQGNNLGTQDNRFNPNPDPKPRATSEIKPMKTILLLAANPKNTDPLRLQEEERDIKERLRLNGYGTEPIKSAVAVRSRDLNQALLDFNPQIIHFSGHGGGEDGLAFEEIDGTFKLISGQALAGLFSLFNDCLECVVLNACYSEVQAQEIVQHIDYVIGMDREIGDKAAIEFAVGFYGAIGAGKDYERAFKMGCNAIHLAGINEHHTPKLLRKV